MKYMLRLERERADAYLKEIKDYRQFLEDLKGWLRHGTTTPAYAADLVQEMLEEYAEPDEFGEAAG